jgi:hypothetical protein
MTNLTSAKEIAFVIEANKKKVNGFVLNFFDSELKSLVPYHRIFLATGESSDIRLRHLVKNPRIIYYTPEPPPNFNARQYFPQDIYLGSMSVWRSLRTCSETRISAAAAKCARRITPLRR